MGARGLDYGSGPGPTLSLMLEEEGYPTETYDPFFSPNAAVLEQRYDFLTCSETAEHFYEPAIEFEQLVKLLLPEGHLALMTLLLQDISRFSDWWYRRDPTHVCFYQPSTIRWIAQRWNLRIAHMTERVVIMQKI